ncbi:calcium-binding protein [Amaricoccus solimangrovi]|uniref:Calcium-binding protein n=1 Tax=Amaricoccus solimangrovi TaxID=2589815 RepID=A0A501WE44_9RHOB|nr:calcium-binding protein [Amaricoccus solimangrovi]TPE47859.1 calcium-binding protein [Amaricoccus solimangrovi]
MFRTIYENDADITLTDEADTAIIQGNNDTVQGGLEDDWLTASLRAGQPAELSTVLSGGNGADALHAALTVDGISYSEPEDPGHVAATLSGGSGNDVVGIDAASLYADQELTASGGSGSDKIDIVSAFIYDVSESDHGEFDNHSAYIDVDGGTGSDTINVSVEQWTFGTVRIDGGSGDDEINSANGENTIYGGDGDDHIAALGQGSSAIDSWGRNTVYGGGGDDFLDLNAHGEFSTSNIAYGDGGEDTLNLYASGYEDISNVADGGAGDDKLSLSLFASGGLYYSASGSNEAHGGDGDDDVRLVIDLTSGEDYAPSYGYNTAYGDDGDDRLSATLTVDDMSGDQFRSELHGGDGDDRLSVRGGDGNSLFGNVGDDTLLGSSGADRLIGGQGDDYLRGRGGEDEFVFKAARSGERDQVADFHIGEDVIDLSDMDANAFRSGNQAFRFSGPDDWHGTGRVWLEDVGRTTTLVHIDTGRTEMTIALLDGREVHADDYGAGDFLL